MIYLLARQSGILTEMTRYTELEDPVSAAGEAQQLLEEDVGCAAERGQEHDRTGDRAGPHVIQTPHLDTNTPK